MNDFVSLVAAIAYMIAAFVLGALVGAAITITVLS